MDTSLRTTAWRQVYKTISLCLSVVFAVVGIIFFLMPDGVFLLFNNISRQLGFAESPLQGFGLYQVLAVGYMYLVSLLAAMMFLHPENKYFIWLLINGKSASSVTSILLFAFHRPYLIYATNGVVDGLIAIFLIFVYRRLKAEPA